MLWTNDVLPVTPDGDSPPDTTDVVITSIDLNAEIVTIKNNGASSIDMTGWKLVSVTGDQTYTFSSFSLAAGATVDILSGPSATGNPPSQLLWTTSYIWNNGGDPGELYDTSDCLISSYP